MQSKPIILVADDEDANRRLLSEILKRAGYDVICTEDGDQALRVVHEEPVSVAVLDVNMPGKSGLSACATIKSEPKTRLLPVVLVTALSSTEDRIRGIKYGADDFLSKPVNRQELLARVHSLLLLKQFTDGMESAENVLYSLALSIEAKDSYTEGHSDRLSRYSVALADHLGLPEDQRVALRWAGIIHDIGKIGVPEHILSKPSRLSEEEMKIMKQHPIIGERICAPLKSLRLVLPIIRHHHEKLDGSGYPDGLKGDQIPLTARILSIVDIYDALTTDRPYRSALQPSEAIALMQKEVSRGWWDGSLVNALEQLILGVKATPDGEAEDSVTESEVIAK